MSGWGLSTPQQGGPPRAAGNIWMTEGRSGEQSAQSKWPVSGAAAGKAWRYQTCQLKRPMNI